MLVIHTLLLGDCNMIDYIGLFMNVLKVINVYPSRLYELQYYNTRTRYQDVCCPIVCCPIEFLAS